MSKIKAELMNAVAFAPQRGESERDNTIRLVLAVQDATDPVWNALSDAAKEWVNAAAVSINALDTNPDGEITPFPDAVAAPAPRARVARAAATPAPAPVPEPEPEPEGADDGLLVGDEISALTKRGKTITGVIKELLVDDAGEQFGIVLEDDTELEFEKLESIDLIGGAAEGAEAAEAVAGAVDDDSVNVGDTLQVVTGRDKTVMGVVVELAEDVVALRLPDDSVEDFTFSRLKSYKVLAYAAASAPAPAPAPAATTRPRVARGAAAATPAATPTAAPAAAPATAPRTRASATGGVSVGKRIQQLMAANTSITLDQLMKTLAAEKIDAKEATVDMQWKANTSFIALLKEAGKLK